jgi:hypothetical protein
VVQVLVDGDFLCEGLEGGGRVGGVGLVKDLEGDFLAVVRGRELDLRGDALAEGLNTRVLVDLRWHYYYIG